LKPFSDSLAPTAASASSYLLICSIISAFSHVHHQLIIQCGHCSRHSIMQPRTIRVLTTV
jgi:hypothetical protein